MTQNWIVVTTINPPTNAIAAISRLVRTGWRAVVIGDLKTPENWSSHGIDYLSVGRQKQLFGDLADMLPYNHYCRKNLGYLYAISQGAECILETDDDNIPYDNFGLNLSGTLNARLVRGSKWINIYKYFTDAHIWPRGLPLDEIANTGEVASDPLEDAFPVQQYLADLDPDVDAIYRLVLNKEVTFDRGPPIALDKGCWTPFNSQNTIFYPQAFALLYLPCHVSFRMTDIWRSFVIQQALWVFDKRIAILPATVKQIRNQHNLMKDFTEEVPGYLENKRIVEILSARAATLSSHSTTAEVGLSLWRALNDATIVSNQEIAIYECWTSALRHALAQRPLQ